MEFCKIVIVPHLGQLAQLPLRDRDGQTILQETGIALKAGDIIHIYKDSAADQQKARVVLKRSGKDRKGRVDRVLPAGAALHDRGMSGSGQTGYFAVEEPDV